MTVEPASTRANRINPDCLDWLYIGTSVAVGNHGCGWPAPGRSGRHLRGSRQCLRVDVLPDARQPAITDSDGEDPVVLERLARGLDLAAGEADDQHAVCLRHEFAGLHERGFHGFGSFLEMILQPRVPAARAGQRPVLARNDPLDIFVTQRQCTWPVAAAECRKKILPDLDILLGAHRNPCTSSRIRSPDTIRPWFKNARIRAGPH